MSENKGEENHQRYTAKTLISKVAGSMYKLQSAVDEHESVLKETIRNVKEGQEGDDDFSNLMKSFGDVLEQLISFPITVLQSQESEYKSIKSIF